MFTRGTPALAFDARDLTDAILADTEVQGYGLSCCQHCGTMRDPRFPFCCELAELQPTPCAGLPALPEAPALAEATRELVAL